MAPAPGVIISLLELNMIKYMYNENHCNPYLTCVYILVLWHIKCYVGQDHIYGKVLPPPMQQGIPKYLETFDKPTILNRIYSFHQMVSSAIPLRVSFIF